MEGAHVTDLWEIASRTGKKLADMNIHTAKDLRDAEAKWIRKKFSVVMERTVQELRGIPCLPVEDEPPAHQAHDFASFRGQNYTVFFLTGIAALIPTLLRYAPLRAWMRIVIGAVLCLLPALAYCTFMLVRIYG